MPINGKTADQMREEFYEALRREREERDAAFREERAERLEAGRRFEEEMRQRQIERDRDWKKITGEWGRFNNDEGGMVEYEGVAALRDLPEIGGMPVEEVVHSLKLAKKGREYDGVLRCPRAVVLLEFKRRLTCEHVRKFMREQLPGFRRDFPDLVAGKTLYGAVAGATLSDATRTLARKNGLFAIRLPANRRAEILNDKARPQGAGKEAE